ncbi:MAG: hypothetical protein VKL39_05810 [Leptolyngbyaceae bacterium]|nr:hypothetical protein [Leptolyngbyaceae bacterium]
MKPSTSVHQVYINNAYLGSHLSNLSNIQLPKQCYLLGLIRKNKVFSLADDPVVLEQDWIFAVALSESLLPEFDLCLKGRKTLERLNVPTFER